MSTVADLYDDSEFEDLLSEAEANTANGWEEDFVTGIREKWDQYGRRMFISEKQNDILNKIANDES